MKRTLSLILALLCLFMAGCGEAGIQSQEDLPGRPIGAVTGSIGQYYAQAFTSKGCTVVTFDTPEMLAAALESGVIDAAIAGEEDASACLKASRKLKALDDPLAAEGFSVAVALENPDLLEVVNGALASLAEQGFIRSAVNSYEHGRVPSWNYDGEGTFEKTLTVAVDTTMPPYAYYDEEGTLIGLDVDVARAVACIIGVNVEFIHVDHEGLIDSVRMGNAALALGALAATEENLELACFSTPYAEAAQQIIVRKR